MTNNAPHHEGLKVAGVAWDSTHQPYEQWNQSAYPHELNSNPDLEPSAKLQGPHGDIQDDPRPMLEHSGPANKRKELKDLIHNELTNRKS